MAETVSDFYDNLASQYHLIFDDWEASMGRQSAALGPIPERECGAGGRRVLDCACGIGTQSPGLAKLGFRITGCDLSPCAVERARAEAASRGLDLSLHVADMRRLSDVLESGFDAAISMDNALPHLDSDQDLCQAAAQIRSKLRPGGVLLAGIRDYDLLAVERPPP